MERRLTCFQQLSQNHCEAPSSVTLAGQAQKEPFINHALTVIDALFQGVVTDSLTSPPLSPVEGASYRVLEGATGDWSTHVDDIAVRVGGTWEFISPQDGMAIFDRSAGNSLRFSGGWQSAIEPDVPTGGGTVDNEARAAISSLIAALRTAGVFGD
jgi:hypothetical protein